MMSLDKAREYYRLGHKMNARNDAGAFMQLFTKLQEEKWRPELRVKFTRTRMAGKAETNGFLAIIVPATMRDYITDVERRTLLHIAVECYHTIATLQRGDDRMIKLLKEFAKHAQPAEIDSDAGQEPENRRMIEL
jgi:hypothetical protein